MSRSLYCRRMWGRRSTGPTWRCPGTAPPWQPWVASPTTSSSSGPCLHRQVGVRLPVQPVRYSQARAGAAHANRLQAVLLQVREDERLESGCRVKTV
jgi:hypothetical protein